MAKKNEHHNGPTDRCTRINDHRTSTNFTCNLWIRYAMVDRAIPSIQWILFLVWSKNRKKHYRNVTSIDSWAQSMRDILLLDFHSLADVFDFSLARVCQFFALCTIKTNRFPQIEAKKAHDQTCKFHLDSKMLPSIWDFHMSGENPGRVNK